MENQNKKPENPQAFPHKHYSFYDGIASISDYETGMTLRDYFAAKAMQALMSTYEESTKVRTWDIAKWSYQQADAMLKQREK